MEKVLIPLYDNDVAPRFDMATDVLLVTVELATGGGPQLEEKVVVLAHASAEEMCRLIASENVQTVICAGIEEEYHQFLTWKGVQVVEDIVGPVDKVVDRYLAGMLDAGTTILPRKNSQ